MPSEARFRPVHTRKLSRRARPAEGPYTIRGPCEDGHVVYRRITACPRERGRTDRMDKWRRGGLTVRKAVVDDLDAIAKLELEFFPEDQVSRRSIAYFLRAPHAPVIAAAIDGELAGLRPPVAAQGFERGSRLFDRGRRALRAPGVGSALLQASEKYARLHNKSQITLEVRYDNAAAIALYEKWGFRPVRRARGLLRRRGRSAALQEIAPSRRPRPQWRRAVRRAASVRRSAGCPAFRLLSRYDCALEGIADLLPLRSAAKLVFRRERVQARSVAMSIETSGMRSGTRAPWLIRREEA